MTVMKSNFVLFLTLIGTTTLEWEDFTLSDGQVITGYEVYGWGRYGKCS